MNEEMNVEVEVAVEAEEVFEDETIVCAQCGKEFLFSAGEKKFYKEKGLVNKPKYCRECRAAEAKVPFQPKPDRPVYCDACFKAKRGY